MWSLENPADLCAGQEWGTRMIVHPLEPTPLYACSSVSARLCFLDLQATCILASGFADQGGTLRDAENEDSAL